MMYKRKNWISCFSLFFTFGFLGCGQGEKASKDVFFSPLSDFGWYSGNREKLERELNNYFENVTSERISDIHALILPHAGYFYSGQTAAYGVHHVSGKRFSRIIIAGPSHQVYMNNYASVPEATHYATPLGEIPLDTVFISKLLKSPFFKTEKRAHSGEHSVQIEIPLFQKVLKDFTLVPIVVGKLDEKTATKMAKTIYDLIDNETLFVVSSDFTHYGNRFNYVPFKKDIRENIKNLDMGAVEFIKNRDLSGFNRYCEKNKATICGKNPISLLLAMLPENSSAHIFKYTTSGDLTKDWDNSVSYVSIGFSCKWKNGVNNADLSQNDKSNLLKLARKTLEYYLKNRKKPSPQEVGVDITNPMREVRGAFVTLHKQGDLRGCIGEIFPRRPLFEAVIDHAVNSGINDYRFSNVTLEELKDIDFEISALTPPKKVASYNDIIIGKHGMVVEKNGRSAVFLPQVAPEQKWDLATTLTHLCRKAGLPEDAWKEGASFEVFEAVVFGEKD